jgi:hypothetical protein
MALLLANFELDDGSACELDLDADLYALNATLYLIRTGASQSRVYHAIKRQLPPDTPLIVAMLSEPPKFKGMAAGSTKWVRRGPAT